MEWHWEQYFLKYLVTLNVDLESRGIQDHHNLSVCNTQSRLHFHVRLANDKNSFSGTSLLSWHYLRVAWSHLEHHQMPGLISGQQLKLTSSFFFLKSAPIIVDNHCSRYEVKDLWNRLNMSELRFQRQCCWLLPSWLQKTPSHWTIGQSEKIQRSSTTSHRKYPTLRSYWILMSFV